MAKIPLPYLDMKWCPALQACSAVPLIPPWLIITPEDGDTNPFAGHASNQLWFRHEIINVFWKMQHRLCLCGMTLSWGQMVTLHCLAVHYVVSYWTISLACPSNVPKPPAQPPAVHDRPAGSLFFSKGIVSWAQSHLAGQAVSELQMDAAQLAVNSPTIMSLKHTYCILSMPGSC